MESMSRLEIRVISTYVDELEHEPWRLEHRLAGSVHKLESAYRTFLAKVDALLDEESVVRARAVTDPAIDLAEEEAFWKRCFELLREGLGLIKQACDETDILSYEPRVIDPDTLSRYTRRVNNYLLWQKGSSEAPDPEGMGSAEAELRAAWES